MPTQPNDSIDIDAAPLRRVVTTARALLEARRDQMLTASEWEALDRAVRAATEQPSVDTRETFTVDAATGALMRRVVPKRGKPYEHMCTKQVFDDVAYAIENLGNATFTMEEVRARIAEGDDANAPPWSQVAVAIAFLKERSCIVLARQRKHVAASDFVYEDALIEYHALREKEPDEAA